MGNKFFWIEVCDKGEISLSLISLGKKAKDQGRVEELPEGPEGKKRPDAS